MLIFFNYKRKKKKYVDFLPHTSSSVIWIDVNPVEKANPKKRVWFNLPLDWFLYLAFSLHEYPFSFWKTGFNEGPQMTKYTRWKLFPPEENPSISQRNKIGLFQAQKIDLCHPHERKSLYKSSCFQKEKVKGTCSCLEKRKNRSMSTKKMEKRDI